MSIRTRFDSLGCISKTIDLNCIIAYDLNGNKHTFKNIPSWKSDNVDIDGNTVASEDLKSIKQMDDDQMSSISDNAFYGSGVEVADIKKVTHIGNSSFQLAYNLSSLKIDNLLSVGIKPFAMCPMLSTIDGLEGNQKYYLVNDGHILIENLDSYTNKIIWGSIPTLKQKVNIPSNIQGIKDYGLYYCSGINEISAQNIETVYQYSMAECRGLTKAYFNNLETIEKCGFLNCINLTYIDAPNLRILGGASFYNCNSLKELKSDKLTIVSTSDLAYCTSLSSIYAPNLNSVGIQSFLSCTSLTNVDLSSVSTIKNAGFAYCSNLTSCSFKSLTSIEDMGFAYCSNLKDINCPNILSIGSNAFYNTSLKTISAMEISDCIQINSSTFNGCQNGISVYLKDETVENKFRQDAIWSSLLSGSSPRVILVSKKIELKDYLCFTSQQAGSTLKLNKSSTSAPTITLQYSTDQNTWTDYSWDGTTGTTIPLTNIDDKVYFRAGSKGNTQLGSYDSKYHQFIMSGKIAASGNIMSLLDQTLQSKILSGGYNFRGLFSGCTSLTQAPELPATTLASDCYSYMFYGCTSLTSAPELPATTLALDCYSYMFSGCTSLTSAPELPATTLTTGCYLAIFLDCTNLTQAPELPATTLASYCYHYMFSGCTSLTSAPELPATTLALDCYSYMFYNCTSLTSAPELPATTLADYCYSYMFSGCKNLKISKNGTSGSTVLDMTKISSIPTDAVTDMFTSTGGTFTSDPTLNNKYLCYS